MKKEEVLKTLNNEALEKELENHLSGLKQGYKQPPEVSREEIVSTHLFNKDKVNKELILNGYNPIFKPSIPTPNIKTIKKVCVDTDEAIKGENTIKKEVVKPKRIEKRKSLKLDIETYNKLLSINNQPIIAVRMAVEFYIKNHKKEVVINDKKEVR